MLGTSLPLCTQAGFTPVMLVAAHGFNVSKDKDTLDSLIAQSDINISSQKVQPIFWFSSRTIHVY